MRIEAIVPKSIWCKYFDSREHHKCHYPHLDFLSNQRTGTALLLTPGSWLILTVAYSFADLSFSRFLVIPVRNKDWWQRCGQSNRSSRVLVDHRVCQVLAGDSNRISIPIRVGLAGLLSVPFIVFRSSSAVVVNNNSVLIKLELGLGTSLLIRCRKRRKSRRKQRTAATTHIAFSEKPKKNKLAALCFGPVRREREIAEWIAIQLRMSPLCLPAKPASRDLSTVHQHKGPTFVEWGTQLQCMARQGILHDCLKYSSGQSACSLANT